MNHQREWVGLVLASATFLLVAGLAVMVIYDNLNPQPLPPYVVHVGTGAVSVGYGANEWWQEGDFVLFRSASSGKLRRIPLSAIQEIEETQ